MCADQLVWGALRDGNEHYLSSVRSRFWSGMVFPYMMRRWGAIVTTLEMGGFSISLLKMDEELKKYYDMPCACPIIPREVLLLMDSAARCGRRGRSRAGRGKSSLSPGRGP